MTLMRIEVRMPTLEEYAARRRQEEMELQHGVSPEGLPSEPLPDATVHRRRSTARAASL